MFICNAARGAGPGVLQFCGEPVTLAAVNERIKLLLDSLDRAYDKKSWHGTGLRGALRGLDVDVALWRPGPDRRNIWEYVLHAAYWKYIVRRKLATEEGPRFERAPSNFPALPADPTAAALKTDIAFLKHEHDLLRAGIQAFPASRLDESAGEFTYAALICGVAAHDLYHTGQIQLLKRLCGGAAAK